MWGVSILGFGLVRMDILTPLCGSAVEAAALGVSLVITLDCVMTFFGSAANDAAYNAWLTDVGDDSNRGKIEGINAMMPLVAILVVFGGFMGFNLDLVSSWSMIFVIIGGVVILLGAAGLFLIEEVPGKNRENKAHFTYLQNVLYSFRISTFQKNKLLFVYYEKSLQMSKLSEEYRALCSNVNVRLHDFIFQCEYGSGVYWFSAHDERLPYRYGGVWCQDP